MVAKCDQLFGDVYLCCLETIAIVVRLIWNKMDGCDIQDYVIVQAL